MIMVLCANAKDTNVHFRFSLTVIVVVALHR